MRGKSANLLQTGPVHDGRMSYVLMLACVRACVRACVCACVRVCVRACLGYSASNRLQACRLGSPGGDVAAPGVDLQPNPRRPACAAHAPWRARATV